MERAFQIGAAVLIGAAAIFYLLGNFDGVFISVVLCCLSFFLSVRFQVKERLKARAEEEAGNELIGAGEPDLEEIPDLSEAEAETERYQSEP